MIQGNKPHEADVNIIKHSLLRVKIKERKFFKMTIQDLYEAVDDIYSPEYDELSTIVWDNCIEPIIAKDSENGYDIERKLVELLECERRNAFEVGYKTAISLIFAGVTAE